MIILPFLLLLLLFAARTWGGGLLAPHLSAAAVTAFNHGVMVAVTIAAAVLLDGLIRFFYWNRFLRRKRKRETPALIKDMLTVALVLLGTSLGLWWQEGVSLTGLITASGATAVILGIALQTVIQDIFSGLSISFDGAYALGDWLTVYTEHMPEPAYGRVTAMTWRSTYLTLEDGRRLMVPNRLTIGQPLINHSRPHEAKRHEVEISTNTHAPVGQTMEMLLGEAFKVVRRPGMAATPVPLVFLTRITQDAMFFRVCFYAWPADVLPSAATSQMRAALMGVLQRNAVPMPVTQIEFRQSPESEATPRGEEILRGLRQVRIFADVLNETEMLALTAECRIMELQRGTQLMREGETAASMFILLMGCAQVTVRATSGAQEEVAVLAGGDFAGEMSLLTGAPRNATVTALTEVRALEVKAPAIAMLLGQNAGLLQRFSQILAERQEGLTAAVNRVGPAAVSESTLLARMRAFFHQVLKS